MNIRTYEVKRIRPVRRRIDWGTALAVLVGWVVVSGFVWWMVMEWTGGVGG